MFHVVFADADECGMDAELLRRLLCSSGTMDTARGLINRDAWDLDIYLHAVTATQQYQELGIECSAAPTVCACLFGNDCTFKRERTILAAAEMYNRVVAQVRVKTTDSWAGVTQYVSTDKEAQEHTCACGKSFASVYVLKNHIVGLGWIIS